MNQFRRSTLSHLFRVSLWFVLFWSVAVFAQPSLQPIMTNGLDSNRVTLVFLSEGYKSSQLGAFLNDCTNAMLTLLNRAPFTDYPRHFNAYAIPVASTDSGSDHPSSGLLRSTYFNSTYDSDERLITIPSNSQGQGKVDALLASLIPTHDIAVLLVNDLIPGGSDGGGKTVIVATSAFSYLAHETGHVLAGLGDEYSSPFPGFPDIEEPNTTREMQRDRIKWKAWIEPETPLPTPPTAAFAQVVGLFEGAHYHSTGWYRPKLDCTMNHLEVAFCEVCAEALVLGIYTHVRPIDAVSPSSRSFSVRSEAPISFSVQVVKPLADTLRVEWQTNDIPVAGATLSSLTLSPRELGNGLHTVTAEVTDLTPRVRNDPMNRVTELVTWSLDVNLIELQMGPVLLLGEGLIAIRVTGTGVSQVFLQGSPDLTSWTSLSTNVFSGGETWFTNHLSSLEFYRASAYP
jgi:hypothetical protein